MDTGYYFKWYELVLSIIEHGLSLQLKRALAQYMLVESTMNHRLPIPILRKVIRVKNVYIKICEFISVFAIH